MAFHKVAAISNHLAHPNIMPLLGVTTDSFELISDWMPGGDLTGYIANHADADRLPLVGFPSTVLCDALTSPPAIRRC